MNERFAVEPGGFGSAHDLARILDMFGPYRGRYIAGYPSRWYEMVLEEVRDWPDVEKMRVKRLLERTKERAGLIRMPSLNYNSVKPWVENVRSVQVGRSPPPFDGAVVFEDVRDGLFVTSDEFDPPVTADDVIEATPQGYARASDVLLTLCSEAYLIDPYLDLVKDNHRVVIAALLAAAQNGRCGRFVLYVRRSNISDEGRLEVAMTRLLRDSKSPVNEIVMNLCDDERSSHPLHARYLLTLRGAVRFEMGFQKLNRPIDVSIAGQAVHEKLIRTFIERELPFSVSESITVRRPVPIGRQR